MSRPSWPCGVRVLFSSRAGCPGHVALHMFSWNGNGKTVNPFFETHILVDFV